MRRAGSCSNEFSAQDGNLLCLQNKGEKIPYSIFNIPYSIFHIEYSIFRIPAAALQRHWEWQTGSRMHPAKLGWLGIPDRETEAQPRIPQGWECQMGQQRARKCFQPMEQPHPSSPNPPTKCDCILLGSSGYQCFNVL